MANRHPAEGGAVEQVAAFLDDGLDVDDIAAALSMSEAEVGRIARALAEARVPAPRNPVEDRTPAPAAVELEEDQAEDVPRPPSRAQVRVAALVIEHSTSGTDLDDLAGALGVRHAVEPAERWLAALAVPEHVHDVGPAWDEDGTAYAWCASCGARWDRASCDICGLPVTALVIAESGLRRHRHHQVAS